MTIQEAMQQRAEMERDLKLRRYERLNRFAVKHETVFAGSSLVEQFPVQELMLSSGIHKIVYNRGIGGYTTEDLMDALDTCVLDLEPETLVLSIGTNDLNGPEISLTQIKKNISYILDRIQSALPGTEVFWIAFYPVNPEAALEGMGEVFQYRTNTRIEEVNEELKAMLLLRGIKYIDANEGLKDSEGRLRREFTIDGIHMYPDGYKVVFDVLRQSLWA